MDPTLLFIAGGAAAIGFYMAWSIGANDVANSMATAVGAKAITFKQAVLIAGILNFAGAVLLGPHVAGTIKDGIVKSSVIADPQTLLLGFVASLLAAALWVTLSTWRELPISTTHSVIGSLIGFGIISRILQSAVDKLRSKGIKAGLLRPITLFPFPVDKLRMLAENENIKELLCVEMNNGQMIDDVKLAINCSKPVHFFSRMGGNVPSIKEVVNKCRELFEEPEQ